MSLKDQIVIVLNKCLIIDHLHTKGLFSLFKAHFSFYVSVEILLPNKKGQLINIIYHI